MRSTYPNGLALSRPNGGAGSSGMRQGAPSLAAENRYASWHVPPAASSGSEGWLLSYLDLITLLLSILVVMLAVSRLPGHATTHTLGLDEHAAQGASMPVVLVGSLALEGSGVATTSILKLGQASSFDNKADSSTVQQRAGGDMAAAPRVDSAEKTQPSPAAIPRPPLPSAKDLGLDDLGKSVAVIINEQSVSFRISDDLLFASGQATLSDAGRDVLRRLATVLNRNSYPVSVEGHSDAMGIRTKQFPSNWELSAGRATSVLRQLARDGVKPQRLRAIGYAQTKPLESNDTPAGRAINRRVELIMEIKPPGDPGN